MGIKSLGNALSSFKYIFGRTGTEASGAAGSGDGYIRSASGGNQATATGFTNGGYKYHVFTSSGALTVTDGSGEIQFLVVAGGGGAGYGNGGGAGAGGLRTNDPAVPAPMKVTSTVTLNPGPYTITVGSGGLTTDPSSPNLYPNRIGSDSSIGSLVVASGGGAGGPMPSPDQPNMDGGSGGGSEPHAGSTIVSTDPLSPNKQGHDGAPAPAPGGGGGGGAGGGAPGAAGGAKCACPAFSSPIIHPGCPMPGAWQTYVGATGEYAGGGYGYPDRANSFNAPNISPNVGLDDYAGIVNTGGGADSNNDNVYGGKGIVIIRYPE